MLSLCGETIYLNVSMQHWTKVISGNKPFFRSDHTACCIAGPLTGQKDPLLMMVGGLVSGVGAAGDVWLLDVDKGMWSEVGIRLCRQ